MKLGILSMQKVINYGSFLQAYSLKKIIKEVSGEDDIFFVDIEKGKTLQCNKGINLCLKRIRVFIKIIIKGLLLETIKDKKYINKLKNQFENNFFSLLGINDNDDVKNKYFDCVVIGSDEVFHCCQNADWGFTSQLLGNVHNTKRVVSYAASFGTTTYEQIKKNGIEKDVVESLSKLKYISVRDQQSFKNIKKLLDRKAFIHFDPVLLSNLSKEIEKSPDFIDENDFLIIYSYTGRIVDKKEISAIKKFSKEKKLKIYTIFCRYNWADKTIIPDSPFQILKIFRMAKYVISDTFHGSIFSIITHSNFCTLIRKSNKEKIESMLSMLELGDKAVYDPKDIKSCLEKDVNYEKVDVIRTEHLKNTCDYLKKCFDLKDDRDEENRYSY